MDELLTFLASTVRVSTPLLFAALGGLYSERSGVINIALEGKMLMGAFAGAAIAFATHSAWWGALGAGVAGALTAMVYAFFVIQWRADQIRDGVIPSGGMRPVPCGTRWPPRR